MILTVIKQWGGFNVGRIQDFKGEVNNNNSELNVSDDKLLEFSIWNSNGSIASKEDSCVAENEEYVVVVKGKGLIPTDLLEMLKISGIASLRRIKANCSVAIINKITQQLVLYRGPIGRYSLFWTKSLNKLLWSTYLDDLVTDQAKLSLAYFKRYFITMGYVDSWSETPYENVYRVPRGTAIIFSSFDTDPTILFNDSLQISTEVSNFKEHDVVDGYLHYLNQSLSRHKDSEDSVFQCSGGLDSSSLIVANSLNPTSKDVALTLTFEKYDYCDERENAMKVAEASNIPWYQVLGDKLPFSRHILKEHVPIEPGPDVSFYPWRTPFFEFAKQHGYSNIISGYGADDLLLGNFCFIADLIKSGKIFSAFKQAYGSAQRYKEHGLTVAWFFKSYGLFPLLKIPQKAPYFGAWDPTIHQRYFIPSFVEDTVENQYLLQESLRTIESIRLPSEYSTQLARNMSLTFHTFASVDGIGRTLDIEENYPFLDRELVEFVMSLPNKYLIQGSNRKIITTWALGHKFPKDYSPVQGDFYKLTFESLRTNWNQIVEIVSNSPLCDVGLISRKKAIAFLESWKCGKEVDSTQTLNALLGACIWVENKGVSFG